MDERRMTNEQRERERRRKAAAARKAAARYEDPGVGYQRRREQEKDVAVSETCVLHCW